MEKKLEPEKTDVPKEYPYPYLAEWIHQEGWLWNFAGGKWSKEGNNENMISKTTEQLATEWYKLQQLKQLPESKREKELADLRAERDKVKDECKDWKFAHSILLAENERLKAENELLKKENEMLRNGKGSI